MMEDNDNALLVDVDNDNDVLEDAALMNGRVGRVLCVDRDVVIIATIQTLMEQESNDRNQMNTNPISSNDVHLIQINT